MSVPVNEFLVFNVVPYSRISHTLDYPRPPPQPHPPTHLLSY